MHAWGKLSMTKEQILKDKLRSADNMKDMNYAVSALEEYFADTNIDFWWIARELERYTEQEYIELRKDSTQLHTIMDIVGAETIEDLERLAIDGTKFDEQKIEQVEALLEIKQELAKVYTTLLALLP